MHVTRFTANAAGKEVEFTQIDWNNVPENGLLLLDENLGVFTAQPDDPYSMFSVLGGQINPTTGFLRILEPSTPVVLISGQVGLIIKDVHSIFRIDLLTGNYDWLKPQLPPQNTHQYRMSQVPDNSSDMRAEIVSAIVTGSYQPVAQTYNGHAATIILDGSPCYVLVNANEPNRVTCTDYLQRLMPVDHALMTKLHQVIVLRSPVSQTTQNTTADKWNKASDQVTYLSRVVREPTEFGITVIGQTTANSQLATTQYADNMGLSIIANRLGGKNRIFVKLSTGAWVVLGTTPNRGWSARKDVVSKEYVSFRWAGVEGNNEAKIDIYTQLDMLEEIYNALQ